MAEAMFVCDKNKFPIKISNPLFYIRTQYTFLYTFLNLLLENSISS